MQWMRKIHRPNVIAIAGNGINLANSPAIPNKKQINLQKTVLISVHIKTSFT